MSVLIKGGLLFGMIVFALGNCRSPDNAVAKDVDGMPVNGELSQSTQKAGHGMVIFGNKTIYLYHLPMWHGVHAWQIVLEASLDADSLTLYQSDRANGSKLNTFSPERFALADIAPGYHINGVLYRGHFEQGGRPLREGVVSVLTVKRVILIKPLHPNENARTTPLFRVFGQNTEWYAAHLASHSPDFDQIVAIQSSPDVLSQEQLGGGVSVELPGQANTPENRPAVGKAMTGHLSNGVQLPFVPLSEPYFSVSDLGE